ncbi:hypothetical protein BOTBODRAFT_47675 [Botryobasidium botryosum FD-172 SS1]|uniref:Glycosyltransferase family 32 protein n=1 Tax=Botryobasidium botryosum (strain FD-172 SS1) TaxID=930990 RepID=A0A067MCD8_BOTB1|nr:hypothetical protein BOTBODRAFT_47675 [Botryobasidium botryosum FD-172 SS1]
MPSFFNATPRPSFRDKARLSPLPSHTFHEKEYFAQNSSTTTFPSGWLTFILIPIPLTHRRLKIVLPISPRIWQLSTSRLGRKTASTLGCFLFMLCIFLTFAVGKRFGSSSKTWPQPFQGDPPSLVFDRQDLRKVWEWEIASGHYPSSEKIPQEIGFTSPPRNPSVPPRDSRIRLSSLQAPFLADYAVGYGPQRRYYDPLNETDSRHQAYPPRPLSGSVADLDVIMEHCNFSTSKYVRDCLEVLRVGGGLDNGKRTRRGSIDNWKYLYVEDTVNKTAPSRASPKPDLYRPHLNKNDDVVTIRQKTPLEPPLKLSPPRAPTSPTGDDPCDPDHPRIFHMFWAGPFTDKPYAALLSYLYTQNLGLHHPEGAPQPKNVCRPQFWVWVNPGPAAAVPNPTALREMFTTLRKNPWSSPFLHRRFKDVIKFKMWNTTEQLDGIPELKDEWRNLEDLFNSGGYKFNVKPVNNPATSVVSGSSASAPGPTKPASLEDDTATAPEAAPSTEKEVVEVEEEKEGTGLKELLGSKSEASYDRLSVILSDLARFVLLHRFGGIYLDADTMFLRDWEELWGWKGAFAYRWSRLPVYNTAVLKLNKGSALGSFLFRTALRNGMDLHPMTVAKYTKDAYLEPLLLRLPDALFDAAWLNTEWYQRERPPYPYFTAFKDFFESPSSDGAAPQALGFSGFFRGAFSYHYHNNWWEPFDPARNFPDLGPRFINGERAARAKAQQPLDLEEEEDVSQDRRDLSWATVLKRTLEAYVRGEIPNMYGEWLEW